MMQLLLFILFCLCSLVAVISQNEDDAKLLKLDKLRAAAEKTALINLDDATYESIATDDRSRPYSLMVLFTASHPKFKCTVCGQVGDNFKLIAQSYLDHMSSQGKLDEIDIFFIKVDYINSAGIFKKYDMTQVPQIAFMGPNHGINGDIFQIDMRDKYQVGQTEADVQPLANFLQAKSGISFPIKVSMFWAYINIAIFLGIIASLIKPIINNLEYLVEKVQIKGIWMVVSFGVYVCAISGLIFDIIRNPPSYYINPQTKQAMYFYPQSGNQFVVEGFIIGFLNLGSGLALIFLAAFAPSLGKWRTSAIGFSAFFFVVFFMFVKRFYTMKNQWYNP